MNSKKIIFFVVVILFFLAVFIVKKNSVNISDNLNDGFVSVASAASSDPSTVQGYAWSSNIGWVHFSTSANYSVTFSFDN